MAIKRGFSLIELTVVIGLIGILALAISSIMLTSIVTSNRVRTATKIKQSGNFALVQIQGMLRSAKTIVSCDSLSSTIVITGQDGEPTTLATESDGTNTRIASNSGYYLTPVNSNVTSYSLTCEPNDSEISLVKLSFDLTDTSSEAQNPTHHFETSVNLRNE